MFGFSIRTLEKMIELARAPEDQIRPIVRKWHSLHSLTHKAVDKEEKIKKDSVEVVTYVPCSCFPYGDEEVDRFCHSIAYTVAMKGKIECYVIAAPKFENIFNKLKRWDSEAEKSKADTEENNREMMEEEKQRQEELTKELEEDERKKSEEET